MALGFLEEPTFPNESDCNRILESMYEALGDVVSLQYGGSYLTNRIKSYRKNPAWTTKATDMTQNVRRYYSNTMTDAEKQNAINVFLGVYRPAFEKDPLVSKYVGIFIKFVCLMKRH